MTAPTLIHTVPETPLRVTFQFRSDIITAWNGLEQRAAHRLDPRWIIDCNLMLPKERDNRLAAAALYSQLPAPAVVPLWYEAAYLTQAANASDTVLQGDFSLSDGVAGDTVFFQANGDESLITTGVLDAGDATSITLVDPLGIDLPVGSLVCPTLTGFIQNRPGLNRYPIQSGSVALRISSQGSKPLGGNGSDLAMYQGLPLLTLRPLANELLQDTYDAHTETADYGGRIQVVVHPSLTTIERTRSFKIGSRLQWQGAKLFMSSVHGTRDPFYFATWRPDLHVAEQPSVGGSTFKIFNTDGDPDFDAVWFAGGQGHQDLQLETNGTGSNALLHRRITDISDNLDGTATVTLDTALPVDADSSTLNVVSSLELVRFGADEFALTITGVDAKLTVVLQTIEQ